MSNKTKICFLAYSTKDIDLFLSLTKHSEIEVHILACRLSSFLYALYRGLNAKTIFYIPIKTVIHQFFVPTKNFFDQDIDYRFYKNQKVSKKYIKHASWLYIESIKSKYNFNFDCIFLTGNARIAEQAAEFCFKNNSLIYWEAGPSGNIYFSRSGVNADAEFRKYPFKDFDLAKKFKELCVPSQEISQIPIPFLVSFKALEYFYIIILNIFNNKEFNEFLPRFEIKKTFKNKLISTYPRHFIYFVDQVEIDVNSTHHGSDNEEVIEIFKKLISILKSRYPDIKIIRRSHPRQKQTKISKILQQNFTNKFVDNFDGDLYEGLDKALLVVTVNSTTGLECLLKGKRIFLLGSSYYDSLKGVLTKLDFKDFETMDFKDNSSSSEIKVSANNFILKNFLPIDYRNNFFNYFFGFNDYIKSIICSENKHK
jgi:uncharacterized protein YggU (UPF0235/DUF167 family)